MATFRVTLRIPEPGMVNGAGGVQLAPAGSPEQAKATVPVAPSSFSHSAYVATCPLGTLTPGGVLPLAKASAAFRNLDLPVEWAFPPVQAAHPLDGQDAALLYRDEQRTADELADGEPGGRRDARAWRASVGATARGEAPLIDTLLSPLSVPRAPFQAARFGALGLQPASVLGSWLFHGKHSRALFAGMAAHSVLDLRAPVTGAYGLLLAALAHQSGWPLVRGGSHRLAEALVNRLRQLGGEAEANHPVRDLSDVPRAETILLDLTPRQVLAVCGDRLPAGYARRLRRYRSGWR